ncbi:MAG: DUF167 domain-containing protein [Proteobacteria bacterium]|nr:DUF167 domain-containing protein [Pseudomonadota bacterium]
MPQNFSNLLSSFANGVRLTIKAKPGVSKARAPKIVELAGGKRAVEIAVNAVAEDGKANAAILSFLAKELGLKKSDISIKSGTAGRLKIIEICGNVQELTSKLAIWLEHISIN